MIIYTLPAVPKKTGGLVTGSTYSVLCHDTNSDGRAACESRDTSRQRCRDASPALRQGAHCRARIELLIHRPAPRPGRRTPMLRSALQSDHGQSACLARRLAPGWRIAHPQRCIEMARPDTRCGRSKNIRRRLERTRRCFHSSRLFVHTKQIAAWAGRLLLCHVAGEPALQVGRLVEVQQVVGQAVEHGDGERPHALLVLFTA